jgi:superoxide dismutase
VQSLLTNVESGNARCGTPPCPRRPPQAYVTGANKALEQYSEAEQRGDVAAMLALLPALKFNGGGHINHSQFWNNLVPEKVRNPADAAVQQH